MTLNRESSLNFGENSSICIRDLNETQLSYVTRESAEKDYKELENLITKAVRDEIGNTSLLSNSKLIDKSSSILENDEIWKGDQKPDDSNNFIINFQDLADDKKKKSVFQKSTRNKTLTKKPIHLSIHTPGSSISQRPVKISQDSQKGKEKEEDYNEEIDESIDSKKFEQVTQLKNLEVKTNNLNEISVDSTNSNSSKIKFYTSPDDAFNYRTSYQYTNYSFTPQSAQTPFENLNSFGMFPSIPQSYKMNMHGIQETNLEDIDTNTNNAELEEINTVNQENLYGKTVNNESSATSKFMIKNFNSTRQSTESNESNADGTFNLNFRKYYTPTHQNTGFSRQYNISQVQRELDFTGNAVNNLHNKFNIAQSTKGVKQTAIYNNQNLISPTAQANILSAITNNLNGNSKSNSFCANNIKSPTALKYNVPDFKIRPPITPTAKEETYDFKINLENIIIGKDKRTTLMLRNIPNKYTLQNLVDEINPSFIGKYDYINLPIDYERKLNLGYAFINFNDPFHVVLFHENYYNKKWSKYRSDKKIDLNYAEKQGKKDITCKDENTYFASEDKKINLKKVIVKTELPVKHLDFFKKIYPNSVCVIENKGISGDKTFTVKSLGKK